MFLITARSSIKTNLGRWLSTSLRRNSQTFDPLQKKALTETCYLVDVDDKIIGKASKEECHIVKPDGTIPLHRAFSVYIFTSKGEFVLHKRSPQKITFPDRYTNTCCGHPIADIIGEDEEQNALGIKRAAQRRLNYELGIPIESMPLEKITYMNRIHYMYRGDEKWGEHEIAYMLLLQGDFTITPNSNEISEIHYVPHGEIDRFLQTQNAILSPWFSLILQHRLKLWWNNLHDLQPFQDHKTILRL